MLAAWVEAGSVAISVVLSVVVLFAQRGERRKDIAERAEQEPRKVSGWCRRPVRPDTRDENGGWRVPASIRNGSDQAIWDVSVRLLIAGEPVGAPLLLRSVMAPGEQWDVEWVFGSKVEPFYDTSVTSPRSQLPVPRAVTDTSVVPALEVVFTDSANRTWRRSGAQLAICSDRPKPSAAEIELSRGLELLSGEGGEGASVAAKGALLETLSLAITKALADAGGPKIYVDGAPAWLASKRGHFRVKDGYTEAGQDMAPLLAGAYQVVRENVTYAAVYELDEKTLRRTADLALSVHSCFSALKSSETGMLGLVHD